MVTGPYHEIRDPIHNFVKLDRYERMVLDSRPVQRLRHIHQLAMSYLVYPGATHRRFEHSIGVMELAGRVFDVITAEHNIHESVASVRRQFTTDEIGYWRKVVRLAALCHDVGHLPFSHAAEHDLLPDGWDHERLTAQLILGDPMRQIWERMRPSPNPTDVAKVAVGPRKLPDQTFTDWETLLSDIIGGEAMGVDRMDYLLRDSHHAGVAYGRFDHHRLIDTMRILPANDDSETFLLGIEEGGIHAAESLLLARYFMFMQVYHHRVRTAYDIHLKEFLSEWLPGGQFTADVATHLNLTDDQVLSAISEAAEEPGRAGHDPAFRITRREHFRSVYSVSLRDRQLHSDPLTEIHDACVEKFGIDAVRVVRHTQSRSEFVFPVLDSLGAIISSDQVSEVLNQVPTVNVGIVLMDPEFVADARDWLRIEKSRILGTNT